MNFFAGNIDNFHFFLQNNAMKKIEPIIETSKVSLIQISRVGNFAIYYRIEKSGDKEFDGGFEVIEIQRHNGYTLPGGLQVEASEFYPSSEQWGNHGWTCKTLLEAMVRMKKMAKIEAIPVTVDISGSNVSRSNNSATNVQNRVANPVSTDVVESLPESFTLKELMAIQGIEYPKAFQLVKQLIAQGFVAEAGHVKTEGRGRKPVLYKKIQSANSELANSESANSESANSESANSEPANSESVIVA